MNTICVYCASSRRLEPHYTDAAHRLGTMIAGRGLTLVYGGASIGSMGAVADGALEGGGRVIGIIPQFMDRVEVTHRGLTELRIVQDMHERKKQMLDEADAVVALPGGSGTFEELLEAITWKRLGLFPGPIVMVNTGGFYDGLAGMLHRAIDERFMEERHRHMWDLVEGVDDVLDAITSAGARTAPG